MKKILLAAVVFILTFTGLSAGDGGYWTFGGNIGLGVGDYTNVNVSPQVGYRFNKYFSLGGGINYNYYKHNDYGNSINYLGVNLNAKVYPINYIFGFVQPELQHRWGRIAKAKTKEETFGVMLVGGGVNIPVGYRSSLVMSVYYDVLQEKSTPYGSKIGYSIGYSFGF